MTDWQPSATLPALRRRARLLADIRAFFAARDVLEVDVPVLAATAASDPHILAIAAHCDGATCYLQSSPEYFLKRLLAVGSGAVYCLGKAFRDRERGVYHHPEFTLLEWYRPGWDEHRLIAEVEALLRVVAPGVDVGVAGRASYREVFLSHVRIDPHDGALDDLRRRAAEVAGGDWQREDRATCLELLFSLLVEPRLSPGLVFVTDYPACQAALAALTKDSHDTQVARRFEVFLNGVELANGYYELTDAVEQRARFCADNARRRAAGKPAMPLDEQLLSALATGLPDCAGIALGVDRLLMQILRLPRIDAVLPFTL